jgi:hypothetical protein
MPAKVERRHRQATLEALGFHAETITGHVRLPLYLDGSFSYGPSDSKTLVAQAIADAEQRGYAACTADAVSHCRRWANLNQEIDAHGRGYAAALRDVADEVSGGEHVGAAKSAGGEEG